MNKKVGVIIGYIVVVAVFLAGCIFASTVTLTEDVSVANELGIFTLIPPFIAIVLAFLTKNVIVSLAAGTLSGTYILGIANGKGLFGSIAESFINFVSTIVGSMADGWNAGILLQVLAIGGLIALVTKMGGMKAVAEGLANKAKSKRSSQFATWILGILVFFDDYANSLIVGPMMRPVSDKNRISREKLAFVVDATAAPIAGIALVSTWVGYEIGIIKDAFEGIGQQVGAYNIFLQTIPYRFYNIFILAFVVLGIWMLRDFGPMRKAEMRALKTGKVLDDNAVPMTSDNSEIEYEDKGENKPKMINAIVPIGLLIVTSLLFFYTNGYRALEGDIPSGFFNAVQECYSNADASVVLFEAALVSAFVAVIMGLAQKIFTVKEAVNTWVEGWKSMVITVVILLLAWSIADVIKNQMDADAYLAAALAGNIPPWTVPSLIFLLGSLISFATGTSYGTMGILMPLAVPLAWAVVPGDMSFAIGCTGAVLTGAIFGDHCSPISDTTILSSMGAGCDHIDHVRTQLPYALTVAVIAIVAGYIPTAMGLSPWIALVVGIAVTAVVLRVFGKKVDRIEE